MDELIISYFNQSRSGPTRRDRRYSFGPAPKGRLAESITSGLGDVARRPFGGPADRISAVRGCLRDTAPQQAWNHSDIVHFLDVLDQVHDALQAPPWQLQ